MCLRSRSGSALLADLLLAWSCAVGVVNIQHHIHIENNLVSHSLGLFGHLSEVAGRGSFGFHFSKAVAPLAGKVGRFFETAIKTRNAMPTAVLPHVAAALESGCKCFASLDARQRECARLETLELPPAEIPRDVGTEKP